MTAVSRFFASSSLVLAVAGSAGSLSLSLGLGLKACPLCFYQRAFVMAAACVLIVGAWLDSRRMSVHCLMALPLVWAGLGVAAFHEYLVLSGTLECPLGLFGLGSSPAQSLVLFGLLAVFATGGAVAGKQESSRPLLLSVIATVLLGLGMAWACIASAPPLPPRPARDYDPVKQPLDTCRPPFRGA